jgi:hypothetical protein
MGKSSWNYFVEVPGGMFVGRGEYCYLLAMAADPKKKFTK